MAVERAEPASEERMEAGASRMHTITVITLEHGEHQDTTLYRFPKGDCIQFCPGPSLLGKKVYLYTNYVLEDDNDGEERGFVRNQYYCMDWRREDGELVTGEPVRDTEVYTEVHLSRAGTYHYYFVYENPESQIGPQGSGWFQCEPTLHVGTGAEVLLLDSVTCHTVLTKCLGPFARWERVLRVSKESGYNMIHFTPIQELGASGSGYSICDQLRLDPRYSTSGQRVATLADVEALVTKMRTEWKVVSICDVVLNHTANETQWLAEHPEASYNCANCPHLRPAALLDAALARLTDEVAAGGLRASGVPPVLDQNHHLEAIQRYIETQIFPKLRLHEMFTCDEEAMLEEFLRAARARVPGSQGGSARGSNMTEAKVIMKEEVDKGDEELRLIQDPQYRRLRSTVDMELALRLYNVCGVGDEDMEESTRVKRCGEEFRRQVRALNQAATAQLDENLRQALRNVLAGMRYFRLQEDGPNIKEVSLKNPLVPRYFTYPVEVGNTTEMEEMIYGTEGCAVMAHNGWVMNADPLQDFASKEQGGRVYLRRELVAWGDSVKLRYGSTPEESPFLWSQMRAYVESVAKTFAGLRLDNCHSTPLHVAEYMLDAARRLNPDLYVVAELFTDSPHIDNIFVNRLGITSLIREAQSAWDAHEQGRLVHRFGGRPVGAFLRPDRAPAVPHLPRALLLDLTHDNPSPIKKRSVFDVLSTAALVSVASCGTGSTRGLDELVPHHVHVVEEERWYMEWGAVDSTCGVIAARRELNQLHADLARGGYCEVFVDQLSAETVAVTRHEPTARKSVVLIARTAFTPPAPDAPPASDLRALRIEGRVEEVIFESTLRHRNYLKTGQPFASQEGFERDPRYINGLSMYVAEVRRNLRPDESSAIDVEQKDDDLSLLHLKGLFPGTIVAVRVALSARASAALAQVTQAVRVRADDKDALGLESALQDASLADLNHALYRCDAEERDATTSGVYEVPGHGPLVYAGFQGIMSLLSVVAPKDDLGHPVCENLRAGLWLPEHACTRLNTRTALRAFADRARDLYKPLQHLPRYLVPAYFEAVTRQLHEALMGAALARLAPSVRADTFRRSLALTSVALLGDTPSAPLPLATHVPSLSAGLPHFAVGYMRCWGRDTFIALRGLMLLTGRHQDARDHIMGFAACLRHGLIPNLLASGVGARYNCRDAVWWWLHSIKQYVMEVEGGEALLSELVLRLYPRDDTDPPCTPRTAVAQPLHQVMQEALDAHFQGRSFRERNAGRNLDAHMTDRGFNVQFGVDPETGFPFGGNDANCGTWMDKMGSSERAGNRGRPATPRDGSAVEIVGLAYATIAWLAHKHEAGHYPHAGVSRTLAQPAKGTIMWTWAQWAERIRRNFERHFWISATPSVADDRPDLIHRRGIYKDTYGASQPWADYQLRCNFPVAMAVAPDLFDPRHAWLALDRVEALLLGPLGVKTLDPADWAYRPDYDNDDDSNDPTVAHGFNYHQGPEWVWPLGYYLRARLVFGLQTDRWFRTARHVLTSLGPLLAELQTSPWCGLPELTNASGSYCRHSCHIQAWSSGSIMEVLADIEAMSRLRPLPAD